MNFVQLCWLFSLIWFVGGKESSGEHPKEGILRGSEGYSDSDSIRMSLDQKLLETQMQNRHRRQAADYNDAANSDSLERTSKNGSPSGKKDDVLSNNGLPTILEQTFIRNYTGEYSYK